MFICPIKSKRGRMVHHCNYVYIDKTGITINNSIVHKHKGGGGVILNISNSFNRDV